MTIRLLAREDLIKTGDVDQADWNYDGILGFVSRRRFHMVTSLLPKQKVGKILEVGYGSGVFMPELSRHAAEVYGVDVHERSKEVAASLARAGVNASLQTAPSEALPFSDGTFDVVVAVSTMEFVADVKRSAREFARVLRPSGYAIVVTPGTHPLLDRALFLFTGRSAKDDFADRRKLVVPTLLEELKHDRSTWFPVKSQLCVYRALRLQPR